MENPSDQATIDDTLEAQTIQALRRLFANEASGDAPPPAEAVDATMLIGEVTDTHHPDTMGRIRVKWPTPHGDECARWLECVDGVKPNVGDRVLLQAPANWPEYVICGVMKRARRGEPSRATAEPAIALSLQEDKCVQVADAAGRPLLRIRPSPDGPVVTLLDADVNIEVAGKLRLSAQTLELAAGRGGVDIRTEADTVVRSRYIRLN